MARRKTKTTVNLKRSKTLTEEFKDCVKRSMENWYDMAVIAYEIYKTEEWTRLGYLSLSDYVQEELEPLGISYRKFMYRVKMGEAIIKYEIPKDKIINLGWTKFKDVASWLMHSDVSGEELEEVINTVSELSTRETQDFLMQKKMEYKKEPVRKIARVTFSLLDEQVSILEEALKIACEYAQTDDKNIALTYICSDFLMNHSVDNEVISKLREEVLKKSKSQTTNKKTKRRIKDV